MEKMLHTSTPFDSNHATPKKVEQLTNGTSMYSEGQTRPSPSGKGRKWSEKFAKFHISGTNARRKKNKNKVPESLPLMGSHTFLPSEDMLGSPSPITPNSTSSFFSAQLLHQPQYPLRTASLSYSPSGSSETMKTLSSPISNQTPYNQSLERETGSFLPFLPHSNSQDESVGRSRSVKKKSFLNSLCTLCREPISSRNNGERILELQCGHLAHQECLLVSFSSEASDISNLESLFPQCNQCWKEHQRRIRCIPKESDLADNLISNILLHKSTELSDSISLGKQIGINQEYNIYSSSTANSHLSAGTQQKSTPSLGYTPLSNSEPMFTAMQDPSPTGRFSRVFESKTASKTVPSVTHSLQLTTPSPISDSFTPGPNMGPAISRQYSVGSLLSVTTSATNKSVDASIDESHAISWKDSGASSVPLLRSYFLNLLLAKFGHKITARELDSKYGLLRIVDELSVSFDSESYFECWCYLFKNALILLHVVDAEEDRNGGDGGDKNGSLLPLFQRDFEDIDIFLPTVIADVVPVDPSILKCVFQIGSDADHPKTIYFKETSNSGENKIIQKWVTAFLDPGLPFNESYFTSTLPLPPIITRISDEANNTNTFTGLVKPNKIVEVSTLTNKHANIIIRKGFTLPADSQTYCDANNTIASMISTFRSIISIKCSIPDDLVVVLQVQFSKLRTKHEFNVLHNTLIALALKFPFFYVCILDQDGYIIANSSINELLRDYQSMEEMINLQPKGRFDPVWLRKILYPEGINNNLGIVVVSNCDMDEQRSCLFWNFTGFKCKGKSAANEVKIRVGYLNMDYTDRIEDLIEVDAWDFLLESVCYAFNLNFENENPDTRTLEWSE